MKHLLVLLSVSFIASNAIAAYPFAISGDKVSAIFKHEPLWRKLGGAVETIVFKGHTDNVSTFAITTTESYPVKSPHGVTFKYEQVPCLVLVQVSAKDPSDLAADWVVKNVDFTACPKTTGQ